MTIDKVLRALEEERALAEAEDAEAEEVSSVEKKKQIENIAGALGNLIDSVQAPKRRGRSKANV